MWRKNNCEWLDLNTTLVKVQLSSAAVKALGGIHLNTTLVKVQLHFSLDIVSFF